MQALSIKPQPLAIKPFSSSFFDRSYWDTFFGDVPVKTCTLPIDVVNNETNYEVKIHMTGLKKENTTINLDGRRLAVSYVEQEDNNTYYLKETTSRSVNRSILLPSDIDENQVSKATYEDGILKMTIGKVKNQPRLIEIE
jgi:HSP20 family molecular chaperone IbpA